MIWDVDRKDLVPFLRFIDKFHLVLGLTYVRLDCAWLLSNGYNDGRELSLFLTHIDGWDKRDLRGTNVREGTRPWDVEGPFCVLKHL